MARLVLGIETSCDETSASVVRWENGAPSLGSLIILSQDVHRIFGGVVPELASRAHVQAIGPVVEQALREAECRFEDLDGIAVTAGPGLVGALLVGVMYGKTLAFSLDRPLIGVNHLEGHLFAPTLEDPEFEPPFVGLLVSGGHTMLLDVPQWGEYRLLGQTLDDAAGEAFDKVANLLGLGYPGGAAIERLAREGQPGRFRFPSPMLQELDREGANRYAFSFSGLKTAVLRTVRGDSSGNGPTIDPADVARGFQDAAIQVLGTDPRNTEVCADLRKVSEQLVEINVVPRLESVFFVRCGVEVPPNAKVDGQTGSRTPIILNESSRNEVAAVVIAVPERDVEGTGRVG